MNVEEAIAGWVAAIRAQEETYELLLACGVPPDVLALWHPATTLSSRNWKWAWDYRMWMT